MTKKFIGDASNNVSVGQGTEAYLAYGYGGDDVLTGGAGKDTLWGGAGNDTLKGNDGNDLLKGEAGDDTLSAGKGADSMEGGNGDDWFFSGTDSLVDTLVGGAGSDFYILSNTNVKIVENATTGDMDAVIFNIQAPGTTVAYKLGANLEALAPYMAIISDEAEGSYIQSDPNFQFSGNALDNAILGGSGNDTLNGAEGDDYLRGYIGYDSIFGGAGNDTLWTGQDDLADTLSGGVGDDTFHITNWNFTLAEYSNAGTDQMLIQLDNPGTQWTYQVAGYVENVTVEDQYDEITEEVLIAHAKLTGNNLNNILTTDQGNDTVIGGAGNDTLNGKSGNDLLQGESGNDLLFMQNDNASNTLNGGLGNDTFQSTTSSHWQATQTTNIIQDSGGIDHLDLRGELFLDIDMKAVDGSDTNKNWDSLQIDITERVSTNAYLVNYAPVYSLTNVTAIAKTTIVIENYFDNTTTDLTALKAGQGYLEDISFAHFQSSRNDDIGEDLGHLDFQDITSLLQWSSVTLGGVLGFSESYAHLIEDIPEEIWDLYNSEAATFNPYNPYSGPFNPYIVGF